MLKEGETSQHEQEERDVKSGENSSKPHAYRVDDDKNLEEKDLKAHYLFGEGKMKSTTDPGMEGQGMGGQKFGEENLTPAGNDAANPPQNAGEDNAYFARRQPAEEHPEDSNFEAKEDQGGSDIPGPGELPDQQKVGEDRSGKHPTPQEPYREGTADNDGFKPGKEHIET
ncbi:MAG TPA: hypothetical protein VHS53_12210 [Mucilaginibacter sp.]|nr:hypothetical protein [Mucilaginibacter sp.]